jgi:uncharacterized protein (DUF608 family)
MKNLNKYTSALVIFFSVCFDLFAQVNGTSGLPIGGIGTGAIKFNAGQGTFSANFKSPTRNGDYQLLNNTQFQLFTERNNSVLTNEKMKAVLKDGAPDDDAIFPKHYVNFGSTNNISVEMTSYIPFEPKSVSMMCHPCALYEFSITNSSESNAIAAVGFEINTPAVASAIIDSGFESHSSSLEFCLIGAFKDGSGDLSYGNDDGFFSTGLCNNQLSGTTNRLALRVTLAPAEKRILRFVLAWYRIDDPTHYYYTNLWNSAREAAGSALNNFDLFEENDEEIVSRMRASNLPEWLVDQTLNSLVNLVNNSVYFQDGRYCHTEGMWTPEGTMDQMWHARQIYTMINPDLAWQELEWWARTQHVQNYTGQIHHDFGTSFSYVGWDNTEHNDYRDIYEWVDLNCGFIISVYEAFIASADQDKLNYFWPYVKKAAQRILDQVQLYGDSQFPYTFSSSLSSYDAGGNSQAYNTGLSIVAYYIMKYLSDLMGEQSTAAIYNDAFQNAKDGFENRYLDNSFQTGNYCESALGGPWIAGFLKMGPFWDKQKLDNLYLRISNYYNPLSNGLGYNGGSYSEWSPYLVGHLGGFALQTNRTSIWQSLQEDMYERNYLNRNLVFNQQLGIPAKVTSPVLSATSAAGTNQYISIPVLWRNYYDIVGFHQNKFSGELWLEPRLIDNSTHQIQDALILVPDGYAEVTYSTYGESFQNQQIIFKPDNPLNVSSLYVRDIYKDTLNAVSSVKINGTNTEFSRIGSGDESHLKLNWSGTIPPSGITIEIEGEPKPGLGIPSAPQNFQGSALDPSRILLKWKRSSGNVDGYIIETKINGDFQQLASVAASDTLYLDTGLLPSKEYIYRIRAFNSQNLSDVSEELKLSTAKSNNGLILVAINAGGNDYTASDGTQYNSDASSGWVTGGTSYSTSSTIANTNDDVLYQTERYGDFSYSIPLSNDNYNVVLKFAEIYQDNPGSRIFNVSIESEEVIHNLDLYFRTGKNAAYDVVIPVMLTDGTLNINFITIADNAKLSALEIRKRDTTSAVEIADKNAPSDFFLYQNYPNPFNPLTTIKFAIPQENFVTLKVYNVIGEEIATLLNKEIPASVYNVSWDARDVPSGVYFYKIAAGNYSEVKKMLLVK